jgi:hypothetical protein
MPINTDLNIAPFFDDFDANNQYYRILFRPGTALQARELTQMQSIMQGQIENFGNWAFKDGDIVSGCAITDQPQIPYVRMQDAQTNGAGFSPTLLANTRLVSTSSNLQARVILGKQGLGTNYPNTNILYITYNNTGTANQQIFSPNETINVYSIANGSLVAVVNTFSNTANAAVTVTGYAHGISVGAGVVYLNGNFIKVLAPTYGIVNAYGTAAGNNFVGFQLTETIITENQDPSLLDNALGYPNENAPGAYRLKLEPTLVAMDQTKAANTDGFNPIAQYSFGKLVSKAEAAKDFHSIVDDAISTRIYEEAGNYVVNPFVVDTISNAAAPDAANAANGSSDATKVLARINPGVGYAQGHRVELISTRYAPVRRGNDTNSYKSQQVTFNYGSYFVLNEVVGSFNLTTVQTVDLYNKTQTAVTSRTFGNLSVTGTKIGTAQVRCFTYNSGIPGLRDATYLLHVFNIQMIAGYNVNQVLSVYLAGTPKAAGDLSIAGLQSPSTKDQLYSVGRIGLKSLRDSANNNNTQYVYRTQNTAATMLANGYISVSLGGSAAGGTDILPYGNTGSATLASGDGQSFVVISLANNQTAALTGTLNCSTTSNVVTASSPILTSTFYQGDQVLVGSEIRTVTTVSNATTMQLDAAWTSACTTATYYKFIPAGKIIPIYQTGSTGGVYITNSTSFAVATNLALAAPSTVAVTFDVLRTGTVPAQKVIKKNRFIKIQASNNAAGPQGPYSLGVADVHQIRAIYGSADGSYTTSGVDLSAAFAWDHGQKDTHYDYGKIIPTGGYSPTTYPYLLVQLDYFTPNTTPGSGFFTVESYPVDDTNLANTNGIQTKDIPLYIDEGGTQRWLRDYVDFRIPANNVSADTGAIDTSNSSQVTTAIASATVNPSSTLTLAVPTTGLMSPSYGKNMQADYTVYLPRKDLVMITPDTTIKIKEGLSSVAPQSPLSPDNGMTLAVLNIPAYPSLTTDQLDSNRLINQRSINLARDTSTAISITLVMNRRYTMKDIGKLDNRIGNLEYYAALSLLEQKAKATNITDQNGLNRFKNGIFVDPFTDFLGSDVTSPEYSIAIDKRKGVARPKFVTEVIRLDYNTSTSTNIQKTGRLLTLPYTSNTFISQPYATKYRSSAHVASAWNGTVILAPSYSNHVDLNNTASVSITLDNAAPWQQFANSPMGSNYGAWQTTSNVTSNVVTTGTQSVGDNLMVELGYQWIDSTAQAAVDAAISQYQAQGYTIGGTSLTFTGAHGGIGSNASVTKIS